MSGSSPEHSPRVATLREVLAARPVLLVVLAALVLKLLYLAAYLELPFLYGPLFDSQVYLLQARRVLEGRFGDPTLLALSPLYGYWLALLGAGAGSLLPVVVQFGLGIANLLILRRLTDRTFGAPSGMVAALLYLGYGPLLLLESKIMTETLGLTLLLVSLERATADEGLAGDVRPNLAAGAALGLAVLARASLLLTLPFLGLALLGTQRPAGHAELGEHLAGRLPPASSLRGEQKTWAARLRGAPCRRTLTAALALALVLGTYGAWTKLHSGLFVPVILVSNTAARASESAWSGDLSVFRAEGESHVGAFSVVEQARQRLARKARGEPEPARRGLDLAALAAQAPRKLLLALRDRETSFDYGFYGERSELPVLYLCCASFALMMASGMFGLALTVRARQTRAALPLLAVIAGTLATVVMFHPSTRYRLPMVVALMPLAAHAFVSIARLSTLRQRRAAGGVAVLLAAGCVLAQAQPRLEHPGMWQLRVAEAALEEGNAPLARARIERALQVEPHYGAVQERARYLSARLPREPGVPSNARRATER